MKKLIIILVVLALVAGGYFAWKKYFSSDNLVKSIPQDATFVGAVDFKSIVEKAGGKQLNDMNMIKRLREEMSKEQGPVSQVTHELMNDPLKSGLNLLKRVYFFVDQQGGEPVVGMTCGLLSSADFENMLKKFPVTDSIKQEGDLKSLKIEDGVLLTWNREQLIILGSDKKTALDDYMKSLFDHSRGNITSVTGFRDFNGSKFDMGVFMNYNAFYDFTKAMHWPSSATMTEDFYTGLYADYVAQFNDNSVEAKVNYYYSDSKMGEYMMIMNEKGISSEQAKMVTPQNVLALLAFSINPEKTIGLFEKEEAYSGIFKEIEQQVGLKKDELKNLTNGEVTVAMVDVKNEVVTRQRLVFDEKTHEMAYQDVQDSSLMPVFTASMGIKDRQVLDKLMKSSGLQKQGPYYVINAGLQMYMVDNKTGITLTNDQAIADELAQKQELVDMPEPSQSLATKSACAFYLDLNLQHYPQQVIDMMQMMMGPDGYPAFEKTMALFEDIEATTDRSSGVFELRLVKGTGNSLYRILDTVDKNAYAYVADREAKSKKMMEEYEASTQQMDSLTNSSR